MADYDGYGAEGAYQDQHMDDGASAEIDAFLRPKRPQ
jgi:hypothetical protein